MTGRPRRPRGDGSAFYVQSEDCWKAKLTVHDALGRARTRTKRCKTQREARQALVALRKERDAGQVVPTDRLTVAAWLDRWLRDVVQPHLARKTAFGYRQMADLFLRPTLGHLRLADLTAEQIHRAMATWARSDGTGALSAQTVRNAHATLRAALSTAVSFGLIQDNPAKRVRPPTGPAKRRISLATAQVRSLLAAVRGHRLEAVYTVALALGLREAEVCGLRWSDVDLAAGRLTVDQTISRVPGQGRIVGRGKSDAARRTMALPTPCIAALRAHRDRQVVERRLAGDRWQEHGLVYASTIGTPTDARNLLRHLQVTCVTYGILRPDGKPFTFHQLRHTAASLLLLQGVPLKVVAGILGHSQISLTADTYSHLLDETSQDAADRMGTFLDGLQSSG